ncbi:MAG: hypothetical protein SNJ55_00850 [Chloroherpetonaceae bacterium]
MKSIILFSAILFTFSFAPQKSEVSEAKSCCVNACCTTCTCGECTSCATCAECTSCCE